MNAFSSLRAGAQGVKPTISNATQSEAGGTWLDEEIRLSGPQGARLLDIALRLLASGPKRRDYQEWYRRRVECVIANALRAHFYRESDKVAYRTGNNDYQASPKWLCGSGIRKTVKQLADAGLISTEAGRWAGGGPSFGDGRAATFSIGSRLGKIIRICRTTATVIDKPAPAPTSLVKLRAARGEGRALLPFSETLETHSWKSDLDEYNRFADAHDVRATLSMQQEFALLRWLNRKLIERSSRQPFVTRIEYFNRHLHRIFNDGSFELGGRLYGAWYQHAPKWVRSRIRIDDSSTVELDFSGMAVRMIYHDRGLDYVEDPYAVSELVDYARILNLPADHFRDAIKKLFQALLNNENQDLSPEMIRLEQSFRPKYTRSQVRDLILKMHDPIKDVFGSGIGKSLQRWDSDIAMDVIISMMDAEILCLPIHDSFVVTSQHAGALREQMMKSYHSSFGYNPIINDG